MDSTPWLDRGMTHRVSDHRKIEPFFRPGKSLSVLHCIVMCNVPIVYINELIFTVGYDKAAQTVMPLFPCGWAQDGKERRAKIANCYFFLNARAHVHKYFIIIIASNRKCVDIKLSTRCGVWFEFVARGRWKTRATAVLYICIFPVCQGIITLRPGVKLGRPPPPHVRVWHFIARMVGPSARL